MKLSIITKIHFLNLVILSCLLLLVNIACENKLSKQGEEKVSTKKGDSSITTDQSSNVVVEVNGIILTQGEVDKKISRTLESMKGQFPRDQMENIKPNVRKEIIEDFITRTLLNQEADKQNIVASESEVKLEIDKMKKRLPEGMTLEAILKPRGMTVEELYEDINSSLRVNKLIESQIKADLTPSDEEIKKYYADNKEKFDTPETVHAHHILIKVGDKDDEKTKGEKKAKIEALRKQLLEGADFGKLAKENSDCPSAKQGGCVGTFPRGRMVKPFEEAAFTQKPNEIGPVIQTKFGYHIIQVLEHNQAKKKTLDEVKDNIRDMLKNQKKQEITKSYTAELREKAKIVYGTTDDSKN